MGTMRIDGQLLRSIIIEAIVNAYQVLGVEKGASEEEIKKAWKKLAAANHTDTGGSKDKIIAINASKQRLGDPTAMFRYGANVDLNIDEKNIPPEWLGNKPGSSSGGGGWGGGGNSGRRPEDDFWDNFWKQKRDDSPPPPPKGPSIRECPWCHRSVAMKNDTGGIFGHRFINHYSKEGGPDKCEGSGKRPTDGPGRGAAGGNAGSSAGPSPGASTGDAGSGNVYRYFTYISGTSKKFWEIEMKGATLYVRYGRIGAHGSQVKTKNFGGSYWRAERYMHALIRNKTSAGYVRSTPPPGPRPSERSAQPPPAAGTSAGTGAPEGEKQPNARQPRAKDVYKVYPWKGARRVVRVGGKLFGTDDGGRLRDGGQTKFNSNDRVKVSSKDGRMHVGSTTSDHSQTWDPIDEVRQVVDELVIEMLAESAGPV